MIPSRLAALLAAAAMAGLPALSCAEEPEPGPAPARSADPAPAPSPPPSAPAQSSAPRAAPDFDLAMEEAAGFASLRSLHIAQNGETLVEEGYNNASANRSANIKSASKSLVSALVGIAIERGVLEGVDQPIAPLLADQLPDDPDPRLAEITIGHLLSMQAGLGRTSGANYGRWVASSNWVRSALAMDFVDEPGGQMLYSTGSTHLLSAILMRETGRNTRVLANDWLGPAGIRIDSWTEDPQGIPLGGNETAMRPASLLALGELYRRGGVTPDGERLLSEDWIAQSWEPRTASRFTGDSYGYGWFTRTMGGHAVHYGWGYGGQMIYVVPDLELTVAITSDPDAPSGRTGYRAQLHRLVEGVIIPAAEARMAMSG